MSRTELPAKANICLRVCEKSRQCEKIGPVEKRKGIPFIYGIINMSYMKGIFIMGKQDKQIQMIILDMNSIIPENDLLRKI